MGPVTLPTIEPRPRRRVLAIGYDPEQRVTLMNQLRRAVAVGIDATFVCVDAASWEPIHPAITVVDLADAERDVVVNRLATMSPQRALGVVGGLAVALRSPRPLVSRAAALAAVTMLVRGGSPCAPRLERWTGSVLYRDLRPWVLWRAARKHLDVIDPDTLDEVIQRDPAAWALAWQLGRINPAIRVSASIDPMATARFAAERAEWLRRNAIHPPGGLKRRVKRVVGPYVRPILRRVRNRRA